MTPSLLDWVTLLNRRSMALKWAMRLNPKSRFDEYLPHAQIDGRPHTESRNRVISCAGRSPRFLIGCGKSAFFNAASNPRGSSIRFMTLSPPGGDLFVANTKGKAHTSATLNSRYKI